MIQLILKRIIPARLRRIIRIVLGDIHTELLMQRYRKNGRPHIPRESSGARSRRIREGFFDKYFNGKGLDIGYGGDLVTPDCRGWDFEHGDAQYLATIQDAEFDFVYSSHTLEHMVNPGVALRNWWRVLKPGGYLILCVPHRDLFGKRKFLPSSGNKYKIIEGKVCNEGHTITDPDLHSDGEYSIEAVVKKIGITCELRY